MRTIMFTVFLALCFSVSFLTAAGCKEYANKSQEAVKKDTAKQGEIMEAAQAAEPVYTPSNFLARKAINEWNRRMDDPEKLWYIYLRAESGAVIGYHICRTVPLSFGTSLTNPKQIFYVEGTDLVLPAPGIDGVYYGAVDPEVYFCFDAETDALIVFKFGNSTIYDKPLDLDAPELKVVKK